jgi:Zn-dependent M28 family amino/carboxypeptidase
MYRQMLAWLLIAAPLFGQVQAVSIDRLRADVFFLASPALEGRRSLTRGADVAAEWIASEFAKAGLRPVVGTSFLQPLPLVEYRVDQQRTGLTVRQGEKESTFRFPGAALFFPADHEAKGGLVFAGYGISAPELGYDDYAGLDVKGKFVLVFEHEPQEDDPASPFLGKGATLHASSSTKVSEAMKRGAAGLLIAPEPNRKHPSTKDLLQKNPALFEMISKGRFQTLDTDAGKIPAIMVAEELAESLLAGSGTTLAQLQASIDKSLKPASRALPGVELEARVVLKERRRAQGANVLGMIEGVDPKLKEETVLVGAHFDHEGTSGESEYMPGADDNASGTAGVVELARVLASSVKKPRRTIVFAAFGAEERGLLGSQYYVEKPPRSLEKTRAMINLDMIGRNETPIEETRELFEVAPDTSNEVNLVGTAYCPDCRKDFKRLNGDGGLRFSFKWDTETRQNIISRSDHFPFGARGVPFVFVFTGLHPDYHQAEDKADKLNYGKMVRILGLTSRVLVEWADTDAPPKFQPPAR